MARNKAAKGKQQQAGRKRGWFGLLAKLALVLLLVLGGYMIYLDAVVQERFAGKRWTVPARVYARPLELYAGQRLQQADFVTELRALGYREIAGAGRPGTMQITGNQVLLHTRGFLFYDGREPAQQLQIGFSGGQVAALRSAKGQNLAVARLEPLFIGGIYPAHQEDRILIRLEDTPGFLIQALTAVEDRDFFSHHGVSLRSIGRALWVNLTSGQVRQGGSTLTQQLVKNFFLTNERSLSRKFNEALMAVLLELHYSKEEILEAYLNEVFLGQDGKRAIHGFGLASQYYFSQPLAELEVHQVALLVGMVKGASYYNPRRHPERALERRNLVLDMLAEQGSLDAEALAMARQQPLDVDRKGSLTDSRYPAFMDLVKRQLREDYRDQDLTEEGLRIFTTLNPVLQQKAETAMTNSFAALQGRSGIEQVEGALLAIRPDSGEVLALLGGRQADFAGFNRVLDASRPIGSLIKPAIYLAALSRPDRYTLTTYLQDRGFTVKDKAGNVWTPQNYDRKEYGTVFLYQGLSRSYNLSTARLGMELGVDRVLETARQLGAAHDWPAYPAMLLGAGSLTPFQVAQMYQTLANDGFHTPLRAIHNVLDAEGQPLGRYPLHVEQRFAAGPVYLLREALRRAMTEGTGRSAYQRIPNSLRVAGKTGTSNEQRDSWFAGYAEDLLAVAWMGRDDNGKTSLTGATGALRLWAELMRQAQPRSLNMQPPDSVVELSVDPAQGLRVHESCAGVVQMPYLKGSEPAFGEFCGSPWPEETHAPEATGSDSDKVRGWLREWLKR